MFELRQRILPLLLRSDPGYPGVQWSASEARKSSLYAECWIVDPDATAVEVWRFADEPGFERFTDRLPVRLGDETVGEINLEEIFARS